MIDHQLAFVEKKHRFVTINIVESSFSLRNVSDGLNNNTLYFNEDERKIYRASDEKLIAKVIESEDGDIEFSNFRWG